VQSLARDGHSSLDFMSVVSASQMRNAGRGCVDPSYISPPVLSAISLTDSVTVRRPGRLRACWTNHRRLYIRFGRWQSLETAAVLRGRMVHSWLRHDRNWVNCHRLSTVEGHKYSRCERYEKFGFF